MFWEVQLMQYTKPTFSISYSWPEKPIFFSLIWKGDKEKFMKRLQRRKIVTEIMYFFDFTLGVEIIVKSCSWTSIVKKSEWILRFMANQGELLQKTYDICILDTIQSHFFKILDYIWKEQKSFRKFQNCIIDFHIVS